MDPVRAAARDLLRTHGPMSLPDLAARLAADGHDLAEDLEALDEHLFPFTEPEWSPTELSDDRLADPGHLLDGLVLTTPLTDEHVAEGQPAVSPDLDPLLEFLLPDGLELAAGGRLEARLDEDGTWRLEGPDDWMPGVVDHLLVARLADGRLHLETVAPTDAPEDTDLVDRLADTYARMRERRPGVEVPDLVLELRALHPRALAEPRAPLSVLLDEAGLARWGDWVLWADELDEEGRPLDLDDVDGTDPGSSLEALALHLVEDHGMTEEQADEFVLLRVLTTGVRMSPPTDLDERERGFVELSRVLAGDDPDDPALDDEAMDLDLGLPRLEAILADDDIADAVPVDLLAADMAAAGPFAVLARRVARGSRDRYATSNAWWLYAQALEFLDADGIETERVLRQALEASADHVAAANDLAWHLDDRGKAGPALSMLVEHGLGDSAHADALREWARPGPTSAGRNDPCPCGSGRKHKVCCAPHNGWPVIDRLDWVFAKLAQFAARLVNTHLVGVVADRAGLHHHARGLPEDVAVASMCLFEGRLVEDFVQLRGPLLPADELEVLREWAQVRAGAYEVVDVEPGAALHLLDLTSGQRHEVVERSASRQLQPGQALMTWLVPYPDGTTRVALGAVPVSVDKRPSVLALLDGEPDAEELAAWYASLFAPPRLHNTDGDPMTLCRTVVSVPDVAAAVDTLAVVGTDAEETTGRPGAVLHAVGEALHLVADGPDGNTIVGIVRPVDGGLELEANSVARIEVLQALVLDRLPDTEVVEDERTPIEEALANWEDAPAPAGTSLEDLDPQAREQVLGALDAWMADAEERWCDEPVPALGGLTPREAADDPTRRPDLKALLAEFPPADSGFEAGRGMDPDRLRALLGLTG